jgi:hypothetical protein
MRLGEHPRKAESRHFFSLFSLSRFDSTFDRGAIVHGVLQAFGVTNGLMANEWAAVMGCQPRNPLRLHPRREMVLLPRQPARVFRRLDYLRDRCFKGLFAANPRHATTALEP